MTSKGLIIQPVCASQSKRLMTMVIIISQVEGPNHSVAYLYSLTF